ncbi:MAG: hypothetical protein WCB12_22475 [Bryobacteraceae bacterium]
MIARFFIALPFDILVTETGEWPTLEIRTDDYHVRVHFPSVIAERPDPTASVVGGVFVKLSAAVFSDNLLVNGKRVARTNVLTLDFIKPEFDRSSTLGGSHDPNSQLAFEIANQVLARIRVYSRAFEIKPVVIGRDPWVLRYLTDDSQDLAVEEGKIRGRAAGQSRVGYASVTPETYQMIVDRAEAAEPYVWDQLLLDARDQLPNTGAATVMASAALENFIGWALDILEREKPLPENLWTWIKERHDEHWLKTPSVGERFDTLLRVFTGQSLKDEPELWKGFTEIRKARNALAHEGIAVTDGKPVDCAKAKALVDTAEKIIAWVERLLPEAHRRARTEATGPFGRRMATAKEADALGRARVVSGQLGTLRAGESVVLGFEPKPEVPPKPDQPEEAPSGGQP